MLKSNSKMLKFRILHLHNNNILILKNLSFHWPGQISTPTLSIKVIHFGDAQSEVKSEDRQIARGLTLRKSYTTFSTFEGSTTPLSNIIRRRLENYFLYNFGAVRPLAFSHGYEISKSCAHTRYVWISTVC